MTGTAYIDNRYEVNRILNRHAVRKLLVEDTHMAFCYTSSAELEMDVSAIMTVLDERREIAEELEPF